MNLFDEESPDKKIRDVEYEIKNYLAEMVAVREAFRLNPGATAVSKEMVSPVEPRHMTDWLLRLRRVKLEAAVNLATLIAKNRVKQGEPEGHAVETTLWIFEWWFENGGDGLQNFAEWMDDREYELELPQAGTLGNSI
jgi:hypothetical protein